MGSEKFCLRWNDFESNISSAFRELRDDKDFFDVTLACDDEQIQAHKVILSACSQFFRNILRRNPHQHPLLYLKGVKFTDLQAVLNFMYHGEVNVAQEELNSFLAVAEELRVKGLTQNQSGSQKSESSSLPKSPPMKSTIRLPERDPVPPPKRPRPPPSTILTTSHTPTDDDDIQELVPVKTEPKETPPPPQPIAPPPQQFYSPHQQASSQALATADDQMEEYQDGSYEDYGDYAGDNMQGYEGASGDGQGADTGAKGLIFGDPSDLLQFVVKDASDSRFHCTLCDKFSHQTRSNTRNHVESKHFPTMFNYPCDQCEMSFSTKNNVAMHRSRKHKPNKDKTINYEQNVFIM